MMSDAISAALFVTLCRPGVVGIAEFGNRWRRRMSPRRTNVGVISLSAAEGKADEASPLSLLLSLTLSGSRLAKFAALR
jgi:hypothetical protein